MNGYFVFEKYIALKTHFNTKSYDYFKYDGVTKTNTLKSYENRKDKIVFESFARNHKSVDMPGLLLSNLIEDPNFWIGNFRTDIYLSWRKRTDSLFYQYQTDISRILRDVHDKESFKLLFKHPSNQHPLILQMLLNNDISIEGFTLFNKHFPFFKTLNKEIAIPIVWERKRFICEKYLGFLKHNEKKYKEYLVLQLKDVINTTSL